MMRWPPIKSFTSKDKRYGFRHFVAINYGGKGAKRWVNLVSVLDGNVRFTILWKELRDPSIWSSGWESLPRDESNPPCEQENTSLNESKTNLDQSCLHPSLDSGLYIPSHPINLRHWFDNDAV